MVTSLCVASDVENDITDDDRDDVEDGLSLIAYCNRIWQEPLEQVAWLIEL